MIFTMNQTNWRDFTMYTAGNKVNINIVDKGLGKKTYAIEGLLWMLSVALAFVTCIIILLDINKPSYYNMLFILPLGAAIINIVFISVFKNIMKNIVITFTIALYFVRNVVTPLVMYFGNYRGSFVYLTNENVFLAIMLMLYETIIIYITLFIYTNRKTINKKSNMAKEIKKAPYKRMNIFPIIFAAIICLDIIAYILVPEIREYYSSIFDVKGTVMMGMHSNTEDLVVRGTLKRALFTLFNVTFSFMQVFLSVYALEKIRNKYGQRFRSIIMSMPIIFIQFLFMTSENMYTFIVIFVLCLVLCKLYPNRIKTILILIGVLVLSAISAIMISKSSLISSSDQLGWESLSMTLQAYFPGVSNMAGVFNIQNPSKLSTLFYDFYGMIPFRGTLFGLEGEKLVLVYTKSNGPGASSNIIPCIGQAYHYLGFILAPIIPASFVVASFKTICKLNKTLRIYRYVTILMVLVFTMLTPILYNFAIFGTRYFATILPMYFISAFSYKTFYSN
jgi:oligosaccharide repeat unit polymerase